ncbi:J domain-containing protein [Arthrobacter sp. 2MCAF14]|uniref:J domain-containing protein n=1 Tax=Arthrobacter sp. 2MCAF14 TaxID=3232982 RepID=UPI003F8E5E29
MTPATMVPGRTDRGPSPSPHVNTHLKHTPPPTMRNNGPDLYDILHIAPTATAREVTRAYRTLMRGLHPDTRPARER